MSSLRRGHANLLCIVPILTDVQRMNTMLGRPRYLYQHSRPMRQTYGARSWLLLSVILGFWKSSGTRRRVAPECAVRRHRHALSTWRLFHFARRLHALVKLRSVARFGIAPMFWQRKLLWQCSDVCCEYNQQVRPPPPSKLCGCIGVLAVAAQVRLRPIFIAVAAALASKHFGCTQFDVGTHCRHPRDCRGQKQSGTMTKAMSPEEAAARAQQAVPCESGAFALGIDHTISQTKHGVHTNDVMNERQPTKQKAKAFL